ncbi:MAG: HAD family hydrolase [Brooklawnia sp.]|uniref:HAD family hydrolase n=1 Tax=Brooklawnia sp. TaxID=2699740 RepID=UPI003C7481CC
MPLLFVDLDNTLSDRAASFRCWAADYLTERFGSASSEMLEAMVVADGDGFTKPDPRIFEVAAQTAGGTLAGAWMVGDAAETDIEGAWAAGIESVWLSRGRRYPDGYVRPTLIAESFDEAVALIVARVAV